GVRVACGQGTTCRSAARATRAPEAPATTGSDRGRRDRRGSSCPWVVLLREGFRGRRAAHAVRGNLTYPTYNRMVVSNADRPTRLRPHVRRPGGRHPPGHRPTRDRRRGGGGRAGKPLSEDLHP